MLLRSVRLKLRYCAEPTLEASLRPSRPGTGNAE